MGRIRTIKPEFCQSEKIGRLSREARLLFIQLWTFVDDHGRCRGNSRLLAANLYPYDQDALELIDSWLLELEHENCIRRYVFDDTTFLDIPNWGKHQRVDNAGKSRIPEYCGEPQRTAANDGKPPLYLGPSTMDLGPSTTLEQSSSDSDDVSRSVLDDWPEDYQERFWKQYPRRIGRKTAFAKLKALRKTGEVTFARLMAGVAKIPIGEARFIPHPITWLNQGRWDDEVSTELPLSGVKNGKSTPSERAYELASKARELELAKGIGRSPDVVGSDDDSGRFAKPISQH